MNLWGGHFIQTTITLSLTSGFAHSASPMFTLLSGSCKPRGCQPCAGRKLLCWMMRTCLWFVHGEVCPLLMGRSGIHRTQCLPHPACFSLQSPAEPTSRGHLTASHSLSHPHPLWHFSCNPRWPTRGTLVNFSLVLSSVGRRRNFLLAADSWKQRPFLERVFESQSDNL